jgi:hypothetical protein
MTVGESRSRQKFGLSGSPLYSLGVIDQMNCILPFHAIHDQLGIVSKPLCYKVIALLVSE